VRFYSVVVSKLHGDVKDAAEVCVLMIQLNSTKAYSVIGVKDMMWF